MNQGKSLETRVTALEEQPGADESNSLLIIHEIVYPPGDGREPWVHRATGHGWQVYREKGEPLETFEARCVLAASAVGCEISFGD